MLPKAELVRARKTIESLYNGRCTITEYHKVTKANKSTGFEEVTILTDQPCKLSFGTNNSTSSANGGASAVAQIVKVFISPDIIIKPGSKLTITQNGVTTVYKNSGQPALYSTHQEITLELFEGWS